MSSLSELGQHNFTGLYMLFLRLAGARDQVFKQVWKYCLRREKGHPRAKAGAEKGQ